MYRLSTYVEITTTLGKLKFDYVTRVETSHSVEMLTDTCTLTLPRNLNLKDKNIRDIIQAGDQVLVQIGYNDENETVFEGFIKTIKPGVPVVITCEDKMYLLKKVKVSNKHYPSVTLSAFLSEWLPAGTEVSVPEVNLGDLRIENEPTLAKVFERFSQDYGLRFFFREGTLYGVLPSTLAAMSGVQTHKLRLSWNTLDNYNLTYVSENDIEVQIVAKTILADNTKLEVKEPEGEFDGNIETWFCDHAKTEADLRVFAQEKLLTHKQERVEGSVTIFGRPFIYPADRVHLLSDRDAEYNEKTFLVKEVKRTFENGYRQTITLGAKIN